jgi:hypothetical protein
MARITLTLLLLAAFAFKASGAERVTIKDKSGKYVGQVIQSGSRAILRDSKGGYVGKVVSNGSRVTVYDKTGKTTFSGRVK